ncbi:MAG: hypothetical protein KA807_06495 [Prolixibacteraceae bacterium]|jgi:hypothetical protein|nr:hypothetical protein [Prolixibacteraceae bacterium]
MEEQQQNPSVKLKLFEKADYEFIAEVLDEEISLKLGTDFFSEADMMTDEELVEWATDYGLFEDDDDNGDSSYRNEDGSPNIESIREYKTEHEADSPMIWSSPEGRAFQFFEENCLDCPDYIEIDLIDSYFPGDNSYGVVVNGMESLKKLQDFLLEKGMKVNFLF